MKQIIAVLRDDRAEKTRADLEAAGIPGIMLLQVTGRGVQKGDAGIGRPAGILPRFIRRHQKNCTSCDTVHGMTDDRDGDPPPSPDDASDSAFLPKCMLMLNADDGDVDRIVMVIVRANQTGRHGDGRIFICPVIGVIRIAASDTGGKSPVMERKEELKNDLSMKQVRAIILPETAQQV